MSRSFFIGLIAALAVVVSAGPALGGPTFRGHVMVGENGNGAVAVCNDSPWLNPKSKGLLAGRYGEGKLAGLKAGAGFSSGPALTSGFMLSTIGCSSVRATPKSCIESVSTSSTRCSCRQSTTTRPATPRRTSSGRATRPVRASAPRTARACSRGGSAGARRRAAAFRPRASASASRRTALSDRGVRDDDRQRRDCDCGSER